MGDRLLAIAWLVQYNACAAARNIMVVAVKRFFSLHLDGRRAGSDPDFQRHPHFFHFQSPITKETSKAEKQLMQLKAESHQHGHNILISLCG